MLSVPGILVGSNDPIPIDRDAVRQRLSVAPTRDHYARAGVDADAIMSAVLKDPAYYAPGFDRSTLGEVNTDLFPKDEFALSVRP